MASTPCIQSSGDGEAGPPAASEQVFGISSDELDAHMPRPTRTGHYGVPPTTWEWKPSVFVADRALAAINAVNAVFKSDTDPGYRIEHQMCYVHATVIWFARSGIAEDPRRKMERDLARINQYCHLPSLVNVAKELMYKKWTEEYNQRDAMSKWKSAWDGYKIFRAHSNDKFYGTLPSDNNMLERKNRTLKADSHREKVCLDSLAHNVVNFVRIEVSDHCLLYSRRAVH